MKRKLTIIPQISVHPSQINVYNQYHWDPCPPERKDKNSDYFAFLKDNGELIEYGGKKYNHLLASERKAAGKVSKIAKRKITKAVEYLIAITANKTVTNRITGRKLSMKVAFITLTLASTQIHSDNEIISKLLNQFLIEIKKYHLVKNYIWRAEKQKNGNIHFHILIDKYIPYQEVRDRWNRIQNKLGYVDRYRNEQLTWHKNGFKLRSNLLPTWPAEKQKRAYERGAKTHWNSPNSTDIHSIRKIINLKNYIVKYITKSPEENSNNENKTEEKIKQTGRIWGCNHELSNLKGARIDIDSMTEKELEKLKNDPSVYIYESNYFSIYYIDFHKLKAKGCNYLFNQLALYLYETFGTPLQQSVG